MRVSLLVLLAVSALCLVSATGSLEAGSDVEWVQPSFIENEMELPGVGGSCGAGGRCVALASPCSAGTAVVWSQCLAGVAKCCVPARGAAPQPTPTPRPAPSPSTRPAAPAGGPVAAKVQAYITCLRSKLGINYVFGGNSDRGYDCSGLTSTCAAKAGVVIPRTSRDQINTPGAIKVPISAMQPGDLIFFGRDKPHHVASYIGKAANGDSQFIEAQQTGTKLMISLNMEKRRRDVLGVRRIFH